MVVSVRVDCARAHVRGYQNRRHPDSETGEVEGRLCILPGIRGDCEGRWHVIVEPAMLVIKHDKESLLPQAAVAAKGVIYPGNKLVAVYDAVRRMLIIRA